MVRLLEWLHRTWLRPETRLHRFFASHKRCVRITAFCTALALYPAFCLLSWLRLALRKCLGLKPAVLFAPTPIINIVDQSRLLRELGYDSRTLVYTVYYITDKFDHNLTPLVQNPALGTWLPNLLFLWSLLRFDLFHFYYDGGLWYGMGIVGPARWLELPLLRLAGKRIIASAYGADVRVRALSEMWQPYNICRECPEPGKHCVCDAGLGARRTKHFRDWSNALLAMGDMHDYVFGSRLDFLYWPINVREVPYVGAKPHDGPVRIVHSPNHRYFKGTKYFEAAVASLRAKGHNVELDIVERVSNEEAKRRYAQADIVAAQCVIGWVGYTEIEAMAAGKPVLTWLRSPAYLAHTSDCPLVSANPAEVEAALERLVCDGALREELGRRSRDYVERHWSFEALKPQYEALHRDVWRHNGLGRALLNVASDFLHGESRYRVGRPLTGGKLGEWPVHSDPLLNLARIESGCYGQPPFDEQGIPRVFHNGQYVEHPGVVALYALNHFHALLMLERVAGAERSGAPAAPGWGTAALSPDSHPDSRPSHLEGFRTAANWLKEHLCVDHHGVGRWLYPFAVSGRQLHVPWCSCFSQGLGISVLLRASQLFPDQDFQRELAAAADLFRVPVSESGVLWEGDGLVFLEEYPEEPPSHVLNGMIAGMFGLNEYHRVTGEAWARELFDRCVKTLKSVLPRYDAPDGVKYDLASPSLISSDYYCYVVQQLLALYAMTGDPFFRRWAKRWRRKSRRLWLRSALRFLRK
jgi:hypothetical protein